MYLEIKIISHKKLSQRSYIEYYYQGKRFREYNGKKLTLEINPNRSKSIKERDSSLKKLQYEFLKAFEGGWNPNLVETEAQADQIKIHQALLEVLHEKLNSPFSLAYKRDLQSVFNKFIEFIPPTLLHQPIEEFHQINFDNFLSQFKSSATYYMNKRRNLAVIFSELVRKKYITYNPLKDTVRQRSVAKLHQTYTKEELITVLNFLKLEYPNLYLCCLLAYGCLLRPHQEFRLLKLSHFNEDYTQIRLSGFENKSKRVRVVNIPIYVREQLIPLLTAIDNTEHNILSRSMEPYNVCYFSLQWSRAKIKMLKEGIIKKNQTIYSFRHTAAVSVYRKTKDLNILQQLLGHSNMIVTLKYLRGLGEANNDDLKSVMPELD